MKFHAGSLLCYEQRGDFRMLLAIGLRPFQAKNIESRRKCVCLGCGRRNDRRRKHLLRRPAGAWVDDVAVTLSLMMKELTAGARSSQGLVVQDELRQTLLGSEGMAEADGPGEGARGWGLGAGGRISFNL